MAPLPFSGTIGATSTANVDLPGGSSSRRAMPEPVTVFALPVEPRSLGGLNGEGGKKRPARRKRPSEKGTRSHSRAVNSEHEEGGEGEDHDDDGDDEHKAKEAKLLGIEDSLALVQSLRQSRLIHLSALLPFFSTRHRTATRYHPPPKDHPYPGGLDPTIAPHTLSHLGRADVRIGPLVFPHTRFGEARVEGGVSEAEGKAILKGEVYTPNVATGSTLDKTGADVTSAGQTEEAAVPQPPLAKQEKVVVSLAKEGHDKSEASNDRSTEKKAPKDVDVSPHTPNKPSVKSDPPQHPPTQENDTSSKDKGQEPTSGAVINSPSQPGPSPAKGAIGTPNINDKVVQAVSAAAARNPALQTLLQAAANGKATPEQLRALANFIATVSEGLEKAARETTASANASTVSSPEAGKTKAKPKAKRGPRKSKADAKSSVAPDTPNKGGASTAGEVQLSPQGSRTLSAPAQAIIPWYPPIVTVEFRENPSARFVLPLWRGALVERRMIHGERSIKMTLLLPGNGSAAAIRASGEDPAALDKAQAKKKAKGKGKGKNTTVEPEENAPAEDDEKASDEAKFNPRKPPSLAQLREPPSEGAETHAVTWLISGSDDGPVSDSLWNIFGRVEGCKTIIDGQEQRPQSDEAHKEGENSSTSSVSLNDAAISALIKRLHVNWQKHDDGLYKPRLRLEASEVSRDLTEHLADRFAPKEQVFYSRPIVRLKRGTGGEEDDVEVLRSVQAAAIGRVKSSKQAQANKSDDEDEEMNDVENASNLALLPGYTSAAATAPERSVDEEASTPSKPKRKRHVAKFNDDGTLKLCQACGTNATPMWRRGPAGKSTLCNACGAKWKVGRLVMPDQPPTASPGAQARAEAAD